MKTLRKLLLTVLCVLIVFAAGAGAIFAWHVNTPVKLPEAPLISIGGRVFGPASADVHTLTVGGHCFKDTGLTGKEADLGSFDSRTAEAQVSEFPGEAPLNGSLSCGSDCTPVRSTLAPGMSISLEKDGMTLLDGVSLAEYNSYVFSENGTYVFDAELKYPKTEGSDEAVYRYRASFELSPLPSAEISSNEAAQGMIVNLRVDPAFYDEKPEISTPLGDPVFIGTDDGCYVCSIPVWYAREPGEYPVEVSLGEWTCSETVTVGVTEFGRQDLTMPQSTVSATRGNPRANEDYAETIKPTYDIADDQKYWEGTFIRPVEGRITTQFGVFRYTNGSKTATRHSGVDLAIAKGTPVPASNSGRVVFAGPVIISGNTVVIEHGGGLKTYYMHLDEINVKEGDMVTKGDIIGKVGTTGYSTGPHLHFEVKMRDMSLDPWSLFDGTSGLYRFYDKDQ